MARRRRHARTPRFDPIDPLHDAAIAEALDLHGYKAHEVAPLLRGFLETWGRRGKGLVVHIITGRGKNSAGAPVLRGKVSSLLKGELKHLVAEWGPDYMEGGFKVRLR